MSLETSQSQALVKDDSTSAVSQDGSLTNYETSDDPRQEASFHVQDNNNSSIMANEDPSDENEISSDSETKTFSVVESDGHRLFVTKYELNLDHGIDDEVPLDEEQLLLVNESSQRQDGQQIQLGVDDDTNLHATLEETEEFEVIEFEDGSTAVIARSDLMEEPLEFSNFVMCQYVTDEEEIETDCQSDSDGIKIRERYDDAISLPDEGDGNRFENSTSQDMMCVGFAIEECFYEETIDSTQAYPDIKEERARMEDSNFSGTKKYEALEMKNGTGCSATESDNQRSGSDGNQLQGQPTNDSGISVKKRTRRFKCTEEGCDKSYTKRFHLQVHQRGHTGDRPYPCLIDGCNKAFATNQRLQLHNRVHTRDKPHKSPDESSERDFGSTDDRTKHGRTHTGKRPSCCPEPECDQSSMTGDARKIRLRKHTGEKPYPCLVSGCGRATESNANYRSHTRKHCGENRYPCTVEGCRKRFIEHSTLHRHLLVHAQQIQKTQAPTVAASEGSVRDVVQADDCMEIVTEEMDHASALFGIIAGVREQPQRESKTKCYVNTRKKKNLK